MYSDTIPPSVLEFPSAPYDLGAAMQAHDACLMRSLQICFPACVYSYDRTTHTALVMPLIKQGVFNKEWAYFRRSLFSVTVRNIQCGGFTFDYPLYVGDTGWVFSSDRDTLLLKSEGAFTHSVLEGDRPLKIIEDDYQQNPATHDLHKLIHGFFIPDNWGNWEFGRFKDNPGLAVGNALYIGSSIDTKDRQQRPEAQQGDKYEQKVSSSIVLQQNGGVHLSSSSDEETCQNVHIAVVKNVVEATAEDTKNGITSLLKVSAEEGIELQHNVIPPGEDETNTTEEKDKEHKQFSLKVKEGDVFIRTKNGNKTIDISFTGGAINIISSDNINIISQTGINATVLGEASISAGKANIMAAEEAAVTAKKVFIAAQESVDVNSADMVNIGTVKAANINAGEQINLAAGKNINVTAPESIQLVTASDVTIMSKQEKAKIGIETLSKGASIDITAKGNQSTINIGGEGEDNHVHVNVPIGQADITCKKSILHAEESIQIESPEISLSGNVKVGGHVDVATLTIDGAPVEKKSHGETEGAEYWG
jgi:hypothetical protein